MTRNMFLNLSVKNVTASTKFYTALGFSIDARFSDDEVACLVINDTTRVMLLSEDRFKTFTPKEVCDAATSTEALICVTCSSKDEVDTIVKNAIKMGGCTYASPQDHGFMYGHGFQDLDGHLWEIIFLSEDSKK